MLKTDKDIESLRFQHRCFSDGSKPCAFLGFQDIPDIENKIYNFIDMNGHDWDDIDEAWDDLIDFFKVEHIYNVSFSGQCGLIFHRVC